MTERLKFFVTIGPEEYPARAALGDLAEMERACGSYAADGQRRPKPAQAILQALSGGGFGASDAYEPIRVSLIAGGMKIGEAKALLDRVYETDGLGALAALSATVLQTAFVGVQRVAKPEGETPSVPASVPLDAIRYGLMQSGVSPDAVYGVSLAEWAAAMASSKSDSPPPDPKAVAEGAEAMLAMMRQAPRKG